MSQIAKNLYFIVHPRPYFLDTSPEHTVNDTYTPPPSSRSALDGFVYGEIEADVVFVQWGTFCSGECGTIHLKFSEGAVELLWPLGQR
jgi:hypothetical protein